NQATGGPHPESLRRRPPQKGSGRRNQFTPFQASRPSSQQAISTRGASAFDGELDVAAERLVCGFVRDLDVEPVTALGKRRQGHRDTTRDRELCRVELRRQVLRIGQLRVRLVEELF